MDKSSAIAAGTFGEWEIGCRYELVKILGKGSYGKVAEATDLYVMNSSIGNPIGSME